VQREAITAELKSFLEREFPNQAVELGESTNLLEEWFVDSLGVVETVLFLEQRFDIELSRADVNGTNFKDIESLSRLVSERLKT
jgi:acyl carrier protein